MGSPDPRSVMRVVGALCANPTDLTVAFPHGGTALGLVTDVVFKPNLRRQELRAEEFGNETVDVIINSETVILGVRVRGQDRDMWDLLWEDPVTGSATGERVAEYPGATRTGNLASARSAKILYSPRNTEGHPALLLYRATLLLDEVQDIALTGKREMTIPALFHGIRDTSGRVYAMGRLEDLTL